ncbi:hypothetical protein J1605_016258 [Eschrichtius robustus]|uniref:Uncharacterized protein n=1 Tax=Eschrichtius robustus TaxID=9764 RepID=A0AB34GAS8_ESCRO|nr:hypothetical protein J1605_016258 [Eschrichtius robustus]
MRCSGIGASRSPSSEPQFPGQCNKGLWWSWSRRSPLPRSVFHAGRGPSPNQAPRHICGRGVRAASSEGAARAQPRRPGPGHPRSLTTIFTCPVSRRDSTRRRLPGSPPPPPPGLQSRASSWPSLRFWLPLSTVTAAANASAFSAVRRRRHVRKPAVRHRVKWAEVGRDLEEAGAGARGRAQNLGLPNHRPTRARRRRDSAAAQE